MLHPPRCSHFFPLVITAWSECDAAWIKTTRSAGCIIPHLQHSDRYHRAKNLPVWVSWLQGYRELSQHQVQPCPENLRTTPYSFWIKPQTCFYLQAAKYQSKKIDWGLQTPNNNTALACFLKTGNDAFWKTCGKLIRPENSSGYYRSRP